MFEVEPNVSRGCDATIPAAENPPATSVDFVMPWVRLDSKRLLELLEVMLFPMECCVLVRLCAVAPLLLAPVDNTFCDPSTVRCSGVAGTNFLSRSRHCSPAWPRVCDNSDAAEGNAPKS